MGMRDAIPVIFAATLLDELNDKLVFGKVATKKYSGEIKEKGDRVKLKGYGDVTINDYNPGDATWDAANPNGLTYQDTHAAAIFLDVDHAKDYAIKLHDITELQSDPAARAHYAKKAAFGLDEQVDTFLAGLYTQAAAGTYALKSTAITTALITSYIGELWTKLQHENIDKKALFVPPWVVEKMRLAGIVHGEDLMGDHMVNGFIKSTLQFDIYMSNNCPALAPVTAGYRRNIITACSYEAMAFVDQMTEAETLRSQGYFADLVRGLHVWGGRLIKPKELVYLDLEEAPETTI